MLLPVLIFLQQPEVLAESADDILTSLIQGMRPEQKDPGVKLSACKAMFAALAFAAQNFENAQECEVIMNTILDAAAGNENVDISVAAYGPFSFLSPTFSFCCSHFLPAVLNEIVLNHYDKLAPSMQKIFKLTLGHISSAPEEVAKQAIEFWYSFFSLLLYFALFRFFFGSETASWLARLG